ncbi:hypothetical protein MMC06_005852 [Schaereria dolodes]|nr:hypothetical protein [Schaereria dolodes]
MSVFNGRRAPNVSQYIANLNAIPSAHDIATQQQEGFNLEDDLAIFTNAEFFDFDLGENIDQSPVNYDPAQEERARRENAAAKGHSGKGLDFVNTDFQYPDLTTFDAATTLTPQPLQTTYASVPLTSASDFTSPTSPFNTTTQLPLNQPTHSRKGSINPLSPSLPSPSITTTPNNTHSLPPTLEASSRFAAEEDKRRRNTAASARFRVKKKQREQALERTAKEASDRAEALEARIAQLEMENKWLRGLVVMRNGDGKDGGGEEVRELWRKFKGEEKEKRSSEAAKKGVGTDAEEKEDAEGERTER